MTIVDGRFDESTKEEILNSMMADAKEFFGSDLNDDELAIIRLFYEPVAERLAQAQEDVGLVLDSAQIDHAEGKALDLLASLVGVSRNSATAATGQVEFSRDTNASKDYTIPEGTTVQTDSSDPVEFDTTKSVTLSSGTKKVTADVKANSTGSKTNVGANTITVLLDHPAGVEDVTNPPATDGGSDEETDASLRSRAKEELATGSRASADALVATVAALDSVRSVTIFINDGNINEIGNSDEGFEIVAAGGNDQEIADTILETKAAGDMPHGGYNGNKVSVSSELANGQSYTVEFSRPVDVKIYVDADLEVTDTFDGKEAVRDRIVQYIGGLLTTSNEVDGKLGVGDDVLIGEVEYAIRDVEGVYDVTSLNIGTSSSPTGTSDITIANGEEADSAATDGSLTLSTTQV